MEVERIIRLAAGAIVLLTLALGVVGSPLFVSSGFLWMTAFVGLNLFQSSFTKFCPLEMLLRRARIGVPSNG